MLNLERYQKLVTTVVRKTVFRYDSASFSEEDLIQEGMIALIRAQRTFREELGIKFETYASNCIKNRIIDIIRKESGAPAESKIEADETAKADPMDLIEKKEIIATVLEKCTDIERAVFNSYIQGYSYQEIAKIFELSPKKIDNTIQKVKILVRD
ncbi:MAG: sigma-70 family RNA polymerase sigma factor [Firmicutes bacterium]|nr:sigma-70 family RNA polymerase sigma factor [Bacillota bacterium]